MFQLQLTSISDNIRESNSHRAGAGKACVHDMACGYGKQWSNYSWHMQLLGMLLRTGVKCIRKHEWLGGSFDYKLMTWHPEPYNILPGNLHSFLEYHWWSFPHPKRGRTFYWNTTPWVFVKCFSRLAVLFLEFGICNVTGQTEAPSKSQKTQSNSARF